MAGPMHQPLRLVLDTNVVVAGLLWSKPPRRVLEAAIAGDRKHLLPIGSHLSIAIVTAREAVERTQAGAMTPDEAAAYPSGCAD